MHQVISGKPALFTLLGELVFVWSEVEYHLMITLSGLLKTGFAEATSIFYSATSNVARLTMVEKLTPFANLSDTDATMLDATRAKLESLNTERNGYVHSLYLIGAGEPLVYKTTLRKPKVVEGNPTTGQAEPLYREALEGHIAKVKAIRATLAAFNSRVFHKIVDPTGLTDELG